MPHRRLTTAVTMAVLCALLVFGIVVGSRALLQPLPGRSTDDPQPVCTTRKVKAGKTVASSDVTVSVFNAGDRSGLASSTLAALGNRGFRLGDTGNAPAGTQVRSVQVWTPDKNDVGAALVARQFGKKTVVRRGKDLGLGVDVVVGNRFKGLVKAPRSLRAQRSIQQVCVPTG